MERECREGRTDGRRIAGKGTRRMAELECSGW